MDTTVELDYCGHSTHNDLL